MKKLILFFMIISLSFASIKTTQAKNYIGQQEEVCGKVDGIYHHRNGHIFLNIDGKYPNQKMSVIIWKNYVNNFNGIHFLNKIICVKGIIKEYKNKPEMFLENKSQLRFK